MHLPRLLRVLPVAALLGAALLWAPASSPAPVAAVGPLPECRLDDILTEPRGYDDWAITQVDWILAVGKGYKPPDLVSISGAGVTGGGLIRKVAFDDLKSMAADAREAGVPLGSVSAFRSYRQQVKLFQRYADGYGFDEAVTFSARPGHSEHQLGLVIDFASAGSTKFVSEQTATGRWLAKNAWKYGWLMSYPDGKADAVCYSYEPWHYRYVGRELAAKIHDAGTTIREYLWASFTQVDPACVALPPPPLETPGKPRSCALADATPTPVSTDLQPTEAASPSSPPDAAGASAPPPSASTPGTTAAPTSTGALAAAAPLGVAVVAGVLAVLALALWRQSRRRSRRRW